MVFDLIPLVVFDLNIVFIILSIAFIFAANIGITIATIGFVIIVAIVAIIIIILGSFGLAGVARLRSVDGAPDRALSSVRARLGLARLACSAGRQVTAVRSRLLKQW